MVAPETFIRLMLGAELSAAGIALGRLTGVALLALGLACWPDGRQAGGPSAALRALLIYRSRDPHLVWLGLGGAPVGRLLWPAVVAHAVYMLLRARAWLGRSR